MDKGSGETQDQCQHLGYWLGKEQSLQLLLERGYRGVDKTRLPKELSPQDSLIPAVALGVELGFSQGQGLGQGRGLR